MERQHHKRTHKIVAVVDFTSVASLVLHSVAETVKQHPRNDIHFVAVVHDSAGILHRKQNESRQAQTAQEKLEQSIARFLADNAHNSNLSQARVFAHARWGEPREEIMSLCVEVAADLIIVGKGPVEESHLIRDGELEFILHNANCAALIVQPTRYDHSALVSQFRHCPGCETTRKGSDGAQWFCSNCDAGAVRIAKVLQTP